MSRPKPNIVLENINKSNFKSDQILEADAIWAVFYQGKPFNLKSQNSLGGYAGSKYKKVSFSNPGHARNLARKLNSLFNTNKFAVYKLTSGEEIK
jgi:hypothetical protein